MFSKYSKIFLKGDKMTKEETRELNNCHLAMDSDMFVVVKLNKGLLNTKLELQT